MYEWFISRRYLKAKHRHGFISLISLISVAGITVGVIALIVVLSVYSGFTDGLRRPDPRHQFPHHRPAGRRQHP